MMDMHRPFLNAVRDDVTLARVPIVHDPFHIMKRGGEAITELRREIYSRRRRAARHRTGNAMARAPSLGKSHG